MIEQSIKEFVSRRLQVVLVDKNGNVLEKNSDFLPIKIGSNLSEFHPFFHSLSAIEFNSGVELKYCCIHLDQHTPNIIADISLLEKKEGILIVIEDLTNHYNYQQTVAQTRNESIINSELLVLKNKELEERERFKNQFIQNFSHELRNPLTGIISITSLLSATSLNDEQERMLDYLKEANTNLKLMLEDTLSISMISSGKLTLHENLFNLSELLKLLDYNYSAKAKFSGLEFNLIIDAKVPEWLMGDRLRMYQVLTNLIDNAFKYTKKGTISLQVSLNQIFANAANLRFNVTDTGPGVAEAEQINIFNSFTQLHAKNGIGEGVGLGLAVVKGLLRLMGSAPKLNSVLGEGSSFLFDINLKKPLPSVLEPLLKKGKKVVERKQKAKKEKKYRILLVEDDVYVQTALFKVLLNNGSFYIDLLNDGQNVMPEIAKTSYDLIIMDVNLPNVSGDKITELIRDFPFNSLKNIPILGTTAYAAEEKINNYLESGMNEVLAKPFEPSDLLDSIFRLLK